MSRIRPAPLSRQAIASLLVSVGQRHSSFFRAVLHQIGLKILNVYCQVTTAQFEGVADPPSRRGSACLGRLTPISIFKCMGCTHYWTEFGPSGVWHLFRRCAPFEHCAFKRGSPPPISSTHRPQVPGPGCGFPRKALEKFWAMPLDGPMFAPLGGVQRRAGVEWGGIPRCLKKKPALPLDHLRPPWGLVQFSLSPTRPTPPTPSAPGSRATSSPPASSWACTSVAGAMAGNQSFQYGTRF